MGTRGWFKKYVEHTPCAKVRLVLEFFVVFARFEYALKASGYFSESHTPDWCAFANKQENITGFKQHVAEKRRLASALNRVLDNPPRIQRFVGENLTWERRSNAPCGDHDLGRAVVALKDMRNNLFHGSKNMLFPGHQGHRDIRLLKDGLTILSALVDLDPKAKSAFLNG